MAARQTQCLIPRTIVDEWENNLFIGRLPYRLANLRVKVYHLERHDVVSFWNATRWGGGVWVLTARWWPFIRSFAGRTHLWRARFNSRFQRCVIGVVTFEMSLVATRFALMFALLGLKLLHRHLWLTRTLLLTNGAPFFLWTTVHTSSIRMQCALSRRSRNTIIIALSQYKSYGFLLYVLNNILIGHLFIDLIPTSRGYNNRDPLCIFDAGIGWKHESRERIAQLHRVSMSRKLTYLCRHQRFIVSVGLSGATTNIQ